MKIRLDFVTNSSSSSFLLTVKKDFLDIKEKFQGDEKLLEEVQLIVNAFLFSGDVIKSEEDLDDMFGPDSGFNKEKKDLKDGYILIMKSIDYNDEETGELLKKLRKNGVIKSIRDLS